MPSVWQTRIFASAGTWLCSVPRSRSEQMISLETLRRSEDISLDFTQDQSRSVNDQLVHTTCSFRSQSWRNGSPGTAILLMQQWPLIQTALTSYHTGNINEKYLHLMSVCIAGKSSRSWSRKISNSGSKIGGQNARGSIITFDETSLVKFLLEY